MKRFRLRNNVPDVYVKQSRDFQLMCDLFDIINNGVKFDIDTIIDMSDTTLCRESMLPYLQSKLGLQTSKEIPSDTLRTILKCFPYVVNNKGCRKGIEQAICLFLNIIYANCNHTIEIKNRDLNAPISGQYIVQIELEDNVLKNLFILDDILKYVIPTGYLLTYELSYSIDDLNTDVMPLDTIKITFVNESKTSKVRETFTNTEMIDDVEIIKKVYNNPNDELDHTPGVIGAIGTTMITSKLDPYSNSGSEDIKANNNKGYLEMEVKNPNEQN